MLLTDSKNIIRGTRMTKKDLVSGKIYWAKKKADMKYRFLVEVAGESPFLFLTSAVAVKPNGDLKPINTAIDDYVDDFRDAAFPAS